jgi:hypothetical protein
MIHAPALLSASALRDEREIAYSYLCSPRSRLFSSFGVFFGHRSGCVPQVVSPGRKISKECQSTRRKETLCVGSTVLGPLCRCACS